MYAGALLAMVESKLCPKWVKNMAEVELSYAFLQHGRRTVFQVARVIRDKQPSVVFLENVKNLVSHDKGNTFTRLVDTKNNVDIRIVGFKIKEIEQFLK